MRRIALHAIGSVNYRTAAKPKIISKNNWRPLLYRSRSYDLTVSWAFGPLFDIVIEGPSQGTPLWSGLHFEGKIKTMAKNKQTAEQVEQTNSETNETQTNGSVVKWGDLSLDLSTVPQATVIALAQRGFTHVLGNEVASSVSGMKKETNEDGSAKYSESELEAFANTKRQEKIAAMVAGTLGVRVGGGVRPTGIDKLIRDIVIAELRAIAVAKKAKLPTKSEELNPLIEARLAKHGDRIRAKAEAQQAELAALTD